MKTDIHFICNRQDVSAQVHSAMTVLDYLRREMQLTGTKEGCREGDCGACTVLIGDLVDGVLRYRSVNSCLLPMKAVAGKHLVTIEGLTEDTLSPVQRAFTEYGATQCGFCTPGFIVSITGYYLNNLQHTEETAIDSAGGNVCRCTGHTTIKRAIYHLLQTIPASDSFDVTHAVETRILPEYFLQIRTRLMELTTRFYKDIFSDSTHFSPALKISGGTDLFVQRGEELEDAEVSFIPPINTPDIKIIGNVCRIDGTASVSSFTDNPLIHSYFPNMPRYAKLFGSLPIRNRATIAGNIANASPIGDMTSILLALDAVVHLTDGSNVRDVPLQCFYLGYKKIDKTAHEIIDAFSFRLPLQGDLFNYEKVSKRTHLDIASVNSSAVIESNDGLISRCGISGGGVYATPIYFKEASEFLMGKPPTDQNFKQAMIMINNAVSPISDARGTAEYKRLLLRQLVTAHFLKFRSVLNNTPEIS